MDVIDHNLINAILDVQNKINSDSKNSINGDDSHVRDIKLACDSPLDVSSITARCAYFNERAVQEQLNFVEGVISGTPNYSISENYITHISDVGAEFDVLFVCSNDPRRANKLFRSYRPILKRKINVVVMAKSTPAARALLLSGGFDDVFDLKTDLREARLRILSYHRRRRITDPLPIAQQLIINNSLDAGMLKSKLTPTEGMVFSRLLEARQRPVPLMTLCNSVSRAQSRTRMTSGRVLLSRIRKKLGPGLAIICQGQAGYALVQTEGLQARWAKQIAAV